ncbi:MAG: DNA repair protein RecO [Candidatus Nomurabacteria bacterium]|jgi:DNA repair protein RecO (recombination protein O)|nr:DNA repair protein RecO [Candidatus Nomurabacteria bacterium]
MKTLRTDGVILRRTNFGEADRIIKVITQRDGIVSVMAKSVRKEKSKLAGGIELFAICDLNLHFGKSELAVLTGARIKTFFDQILVDYDRLQFAYDVLKRIGKTAESMAEPEFYNLLTETLAALNDVKVSLNLIKVWFYLHLANILGHGLNTATDVSGMKLVEGAHYNFDSHGQVFIFNENGSFGTEHIKFLRVLAQNKPAIVAKIADVDKLSRDCTPLALAMAKI